MKLVLAATWNPRGEFPRFQRLLPQLLEAYTDVVISLPPVAKEADVISIQQAVNRSSERLRAVQNPEWSWGRYKALEMGVETQADHIHYADMDRLLRWLETRPGEWRQVLPRLQQVDCLVIGRTAQAYLTHPQALLQTECISNQVVSYFLERQMDVSAGSKGFSRAAAEFILKNSRPKQALGTDAEWPLLVKRGGFRVDYLEVDGLDWESADRYQAEAAGDDQQRELSQSYDADPQHWSQRVQIAEEIVQVALDTMQRSLEGSTCHQ